MRSLSREPQAGKHWEETMKAEWSERSYNHYFLYLPHGFSVVVGWDRDGYKVTFHGSVLKKRFSSVEEAKTSGDALAKRILLQVLETL